MIVYPALDIRGGRAVQLEGGRPEHERVSLDDPIAIARRWIAAGFRSLHVVDLDAALGVGENRQLITAVVASLPVPVQVGGGIRDDASVQALLSAGAARVIVGTRAVKEPEWIGRLSAAHPQRLIVAADVRDEVVLTHGWTADSTCKVDVFLRRLDDLPLAAVLVTDVAVEGKMQGVNTKRFRTLAKATAHPLIAAGGVGSIEDLRALRTTGVAGAVIGMALYTGAIDATRAAEEFAS